MKQAVSDKKVRSAMKMEDEILDELKTLEKTIQKERAEKEEIIKLAEKERAEKEKERAEKEAALQKEAESRKTIEKTVTELQSADFSVERIASVMGLSIEEVNKILHQ